MAKRSHAGALDATDRGVYLRTFAMDEPNEPKDVPLTTRRLRDLPPSLQVHEHAGIWNRPDRPRVVGIVGWITAGLGYANFVIKGGFLVHYFVDMKWLKPDYVAPVLTRNQFAAEVGLTLGDMALGLLAIAAGLGALKLREWGRRLLISYAIASLVLGLLRAIYNFASFDAVMDQAIAAATQPIDRQSAENRQFFVLITATLGMAVWPIIVWTVATRRYVKAAFARAAGAPLPDDGDAGAWRSN